MSGGRCNAQHRLQQCYHSMQCMHMPHVTAVVLMPPPGFRSRGCCQRTKADPLAPVSSPVLR